MKYVVANLKSSMLKDDVNHYLKTLEKDLIKPNNVIIAPSALYIQDFINAGITTAIQNIYEENNDSVTGVITVEQAKSINVPYVIIGHNDKRSLFSENNKVILAKIKLALKYNIKVILCVGETKEHRMLSKTFKVIAEQLSILSSLDASFMQDIIIAYEPVWAIGGTETPTNDDIVSIISFIKGTIQKNNDSDISVIYGGGVNRNNATNLKNIAECDGFLFSRAAYQPESFIEVVNTIYSEK